MFDVKWDRPPGLSPAAKLDVLSPKHYARNLGETGGEACPTSYAR
jgi:hypothetical protein